MRSAQDLWQLSHYSLESAGGECHFAILKVSPKCHQAIEPALRFRSDFHHGWESESLGFGNAKWKEKSWTRVFITAGTFRPRFGRGPAGWRLSCSMKLSQSCISSPRDNLLRSSRIITLVQGFLEERILLLMHSRDLIYFIWLYQKVSNRCIF